ncbi:MAG: hypothetical protein QOG15_1982 [Solirubrobacteraceae bacterium]|jgi:integrase|nr:hypothetical protein [Solirubrobacteraceae bacterium]
MRPRTGQVRIDKRKGGTLTYSLRITMEDGSRPTFLLGHESDGWTWELATKSLEDALAALGRGEVWPPVPAEITAEGTVGEYMDDLKSLHTKRKSKDDWDWRIRHLKPFAPMRPSEVQEVHAIRFRAMLEAGFVEPNLDLAMKDQTSAVGTPPANSSINKFISFLRRVLAHAKKVYGFGPGQDIGGGLHLEEVAGKHTWLERDDVLVFLTAAQHVDRWPQWKLFLNARAVAGLRDGGDRDGDKRNWKVVAAKQGQAVGTVWRQHHLYELAASDTEARETEALMTVLVGSGIRAAEAGTLEVGNVDFRHNRLDVHGTKSENAHRTPDMGPRKMQRLKPYVAAHRHRGLKAPLFITRNGIPRDRSTIRAEVTRVGKRAQLLAEEGILPAIGGVEHLTTHDLRRTYVALLLSRNFDIAYVQDQVGHSKAEVSMILEVYNKVRRIDRSDHWTDLEDDMFGSAA